MKNLAFRLLFTWLLLAVIFGVSLTGLRTLRAQTTTHGVSLTWTAPSVDSTHSAAISYNVLRSTATGEETVLATVQAPTVTYLDTTAVSGTTYFYEVTATNSVGTSGVSNEVSITFLIQLPPNPPVLGAATSK